MKYQWIRDLYNVYFYGGMIFKNLNDCNTILEVGCGKESIILRTGLNKTKIITAIDIYEPYIKAHRLLKDYTICECVDITEAKFTHKQFDAVICMDVLEHIDRQKVIDSNLLEKLKDWGDKVFITTPNGYIENDESDGNKYQAHRSGWNIQDFNGYRVRGLSGLKCLRTKGGNLKYSPFLFWGVISLFSQILVWKFPKYAFHLLAIYEE